MPLKSVSLFKCRKAAVIEPKLMSRYSKVAMLYRRKCIQNHLVQNGGVSAAILKYLRDMGKRELKKIENIPDLVRKDTLRT